MRQLVRVEPAVFVTARLFKGTLAVSGEPRFCDLPLMRNVLQRADTNICPATGKNMSGNSLSNILTGGGNHFDFFGNGDIMFVF